MRAKSKMWTEIKPTRLYIDNPWTWSDASQDSKPCLLLEIVLSDTAISKGNTSVPYSASIQQPANIITPSIDLKSSPNIA